MKKRKSVIFVIIMIIVYALLSALTVLLVSKSGTYPAGSNTMYFLYQGNHLYQGISGEKGLSFYDPYWYNGTELLSFYKLLPVLLLTCFQFLAGGDAANGYLLFVGALFFTEALIWLVIGCKKGRRKMGAFLGVLWFFMPVHLQTLFDAGDIPQTLCLAMLPIFLMQTGDFLFEEKKKAGKWVALLSCLMALCDWDFTEILIFSMLVFALLYTFFFHRKRTMFHLLCYMLLGILLSGFPVYHRITEKQYSAKTLRSMMYADVSASLNPLRRILEGDLSVFYFGLSVFILIVFGIIFSKKKNMTGFWTALILFFFTTTSMYAVLKRLPIGQYLCVTNYIAIALGFALYSFFSWDTLKKPFVTLMIVLLLLDTIPSLKLIYGGLKNIPFDEQVASIEEQTLIDEAKKITKQRITLFDKNSLGAMAPYIISGYDKEVASTFGYGIMHAATRENIVQLNQALSDGYYLYLFDRCIELGSDTVLIQVNQLNAGINDIDNLDAAARKTGYRLVNANGGYRLYHKSVSGTFGVKSKYEAIGIGTSARQMSLCFPTIEETTETNINAFTYEELKKYRVVYLAGFTYTDKKAAEDMLLKLSKNGTKIVILADGMPADEKTGTQMFLGVSCYNIKFYNSYPELKTKNGVLYCDLFPQEYIHWQTAYMNGLDNCWGKIEELDRELGFYGTKENQNIIFIGLNLTFHYALTRDAAVGELLSDAFDLNGSQLPERAIVPLEISYQDDKIEIDSKENDVNTTIAMNENFLLENGMYDKNQLIYTKQGKTNITREPADEWKGCFLTLGAIILIAAYTWKKKVWEKRKANG